MPPYSKPYPLTKVLSNVNTRESSKNGPLSLGASTSLAVYQKRPVDSYLKDVVGYLKEPLELFPKIIVHFQLSVTIQSDGGIERIQGELTIKKHRRSLDSAIDALGVLQQGLFHSRALSEEVEHILYRPEEKCEKFGEKEIQTLTKLKENLLKLNKFLDCVLIHYSSFSGKLPPIDKIKRAAKKIFKAIRNLRPDRLKTMNSTVTEEDILCSVLGLQDDFPDRLRKLSEEMRSHRSDMYFILCFMKERNDALDLSDFPDTAAVEQSLKKIGFTENRSNVVANWICEQPFPEHRSLLAWAEIYIENLFKYDIFLNDLVPVFPFKEKVLDIWFGVDAQRDDDENAHAGLSVSPVQVINTKTEKDAIARINEKITEFEASNPRGQVYFHGTDHAAAKSILENGINLHEGTKGCDFSHGKGFYLADDSNIALQYAQKSKASAVVLFKISEDYLRRGLNLSSHDRQDDLKSVTSYFRSGEARGKRLKTKLSLEVGNCNYIIGPISRDGRPGEGTAWRNVQQMCVKKEEMADQIGNPSRMSIVFLNTRDQV